jgi:hypothetical protein
VAAHEFAERRLVAGAEELNEPIVRPRPFHD